MFVLAFFSSNLFNFSQQRVRHTCLVQMLKNFLSIFRQNKLECSLVVTGAIVTGLFCDNQH
jgi:hypothetical protein